MTRPPRRRRADGFTLVELMLATVLTASIALITLTLAIGQRSQAKLSGEYVRDIDDTRRALDRIEHDLRVGVPDPAAPATIQVGDRAVRYVVVGGALIRQVDGEARVDGAGERLHWNVEELDVRCDGALTHVVLTLGPRARHDGHRARVATTVRQRLGGAR